MSHRVILTEGGGDDAFCQMLLKVCGLDKEFTVYKRIQTKEEKGQNLPPLAGKDSFERYLRAIRTGTERYAPATSSGTTSRSARL